MENDAKGPTPRQSFLWWIFIRPLNDLKSFADFNQGPILNLEVLIETGQ